MTSRARYLLVPLALPLALGAAESVNWDTANNTVTCSDTVAEVLTGVANAVSLSFSQFDAAEAAVQEGEAGTYTLTRVVLSVDGSISGVFSYMNTLSNPGTVYESTLSSNSGFTFAAGDFSAVEALAYTVPSTPFQVAGNSTETRNVSAAGAGGSASFTDALDAFLGSGQLSSTLTLRASQNSETDAGINSGVTVSGPASVSITYYYDYTPVPEPSAGLLLALGCAAIAARRRVRRS